MFSYSIIIIISILFINSNQAIKRRSRLHSDVIEEVMTKRLDTLINEQDFIAVLFYTHENCANCKDVLEELEKIDGVADNHGVEFVKNSERAAAKKHGITKFPTLVYFRHTDPTVFEGDLMNEEQVLEWLTSVEQMDKAKKGSAKTKNRNEF